MDEEGEEMEAHVEGRWVVCEMYGVWCARTRGFADIHFINRRPISIHFEIVIQVR